MKASGGSKNYYNGATNYLPGGMEDDEDEFDIVSTIEHNVEKTCQNMKITILPDASRTAGLNDKPFDASFDDRTSGWFEQFKKVFNVYKKSPTISTTIQTFFNSSPNPYLDALKIIANCSASDYSKNNSVPFKIMEELCTYHNANSQHSGKYIDDNLKMVAFNLIKKHGQQPMKFMVNSFNLIESKQLFIIKIKEFINEHSYKEACQIAYELELFDEFNIFDFVLPLFLQDKYTTAEEYLDRAVHLQKPLVELLDSFLDRSSSVVNNCGVYIAKYDYSDVKYSKLHTKPLTKLITRLSKKFNLEQKVTPNVNRMKNYGALQFLLHKKYVEKSLNKDSWEEMVRVTVSDDHTDLQLELIFGCSDNMDYEEALKWAKKFNINRDKLPGTLKNYIEGNECKVDEPAEDWDEGEIHSDNSSDVIEIKDIPTSSIIHTLSLNDKNSILVDSKEKLDTMLTYLKSQPFVAFDSEWKPTFGATTEVALIQLATKTKVYLVDIVTLNNQSTDWNNLGKYIFNNDEILKIGFAPTSDLSMLQKSLPSLNILSHSLHSISYLDLQEFWRKLNTIKQFRFPYSGENASENLSNLVMKCLGKKLDKSNQFSNWENRPLRPDQIRYAALDAYCLIEIYDVIQRELEKIGINFNDFVHGFLMENKSKGGSIKKKEKINIRENKNRTKRGRQENEELNVSIPSKIPIKVEEIRFVVDTMLGGLGRALRKCGIDTVIIDPRDYHDACIRVSVNDGRCILTRGNLYNKYIQYVSPLHCLRIRADSVDDQLIEVIQHYCIVVKEENIFSRCQECNSNEYIRLTRYEMIELNNHRQLNKNMGHIDDTNSQDIISRSWILNKLTSEHRRTGCTSRGFPMKIFQLPENLIRSNNYFNVCEGCGKCYWDGSHYKNLVAGNMGKILKLNQN